MVLKSSDADLEKIYKRVLDYFSNKSEDFIVEHPEHSSYFKFFSFRKRGSDLNFKVTIGEYGNIYLEVIVVESSMQKGNSFSKSVLGVIEYKSNGDCENKRKVCLPNKRQQQELQEVIEHVQKSIRPNSINFIMDD